MLNKVFVVGFPKCGTTSIHDAVSEAGLKSVHWGWYNSPEYMPKHLVRFGKKVTSVGVMIKQAKDEGKPLLYFLNGFNAFTQMDVTVQGYNYWPQLEDVPLLDRQYPGSKFIFNTRPLDKWISSVNRWGDMKTRLTKADIPGLPYGIGYKDEELINWHEWHRNNMLNYFGGENDKFTIFNIEKDDPQKLAKFLRLEKISLGHKNENTRNPANHSSGVSAAIHAR